MTRSLFDYRGHGHSQSGEEGILARVMHILRIESGLCCEFGAWDGVHLSNTRALMLAGWQGLMIEADPTRYQKLIATYPTGSNCICVCERVGTGNQSVARIAARAGLTKRFDLVSIDIDGLDYEIFESLGDFAHPPIVVIIEVHTCHAANDTRVVPRRIAARGCGQPLGLFVKTGASLGYRLVSYIGTNAIFVHHDAGCVDEMPTLTAADAAGLQHELVRNDRKAREFLFLANLGLEEPGYHFGNPMFTAEQLGISRADANRLIRSRVMTPSALIWLIRTTARNVSDHLRSLIGFSDNRI